MDDDTLVGHCAVEVRYPVYRSSRTCTVEVYVGSCIISKWVLGYGIAASFLSVGGEGT